MEDEEGHVHDQHFFIEWVTHFCQKCQMLGHVCDDGPKDAKSRVEGKSKQQTVIRQQVVGNRQQPVGVASGAVC